MFDFQSEAQVTVEQDSPRNKDNEDGDQETHQKGYRLKPHLPPSFLNEMVFLLCFILT